jgi:hypothetical protein
MIARKNPTPPKPTHLAASMRVVASHLHMRRVDTLTAKQKVKETAEHIASGIAGPESESLAARLEKVTGASIAELADFAKDWPDA